MPPISALLDRRQRKHPIESHHQQVIGILLQKEAFPQPRYFDAIPHDELLKSVARGIVDRHVLRLIKLWLKAPMRNGMMVTRTRRIGGGKSNARGTPQGGVVIPMLANIYMNRFLKYWRLTGRGEAFRAHVVAYADDFVILSRGSAAEALQWERCLSLDDPTCYQASAQSVQHMIFSGVAHLDRMHFDVVLRKLISQ
jgi:hypothetical protein